MSNINRIDDERGKCLLSDKMSFEESRTDKHLNTKKRSKSFIVLLYIVMLYFYFLCLILFFITLNFLSVKSAI